MASNCLVTKLKSSVSDSNLREIGEFRFTANSTVTNDYIFSIGNSDTVVLKNITKGTSTELASGALRRIEANVSEGDVLSLVTKYKITNLTPLLVTFYLDEFTYMPELDSLIINQEVLSGDLSNLGNLENITNIQIKRISITGTVESIVERYVSLFPAKSNDLVLELLNAPNVKFHNVAIAASSDVYLYIQYNGDGTASLYSDSGKTTLIASYNGTTWIYS